MKDKKEKVEEQLYTLKMLKNYCNENFVKKTNKPFTPQDIQQYKIRGRLPEYLGNIKIEVQSHQGVEMYKLIKK